MTTTRVSATQKSLPANTKPTGRIRKWLKRVGLSLLVLVIALPITGATYQFVATKIDEHNFLPMGQMIDVGGYSLHLYCVGQNTDGRSTVVLEPGLGATSSAWAWIQPEIAKTTRVCAYDRAGLGWSAPSPAPRDAQHIATELHTLLARSQTPGPYILVGWSYGGLYVRRYAEQYRNEVSGLVLLDSSSPDQCTSTASGQAQCASFAKIYSVASFLARLGVMRVMSVFQSAPALPSLQRQALVAASSATKDWDAQSAEFLASPATNAQVHAARSLGNMPMFVVTAVNHGTPPELEQLWQVWQKGFTSLSSNSVQQIVPDSTHVSIVFDDTDAKASISAILQVVDTAHTGKSLVH